MPLLVALHTSPQYFDMMQIVFGGMFMLYETYVDMTEYAILISVAAIYILRKKKWIRLI